MATRSQCKRALDVFEDRLSSLKNVVGLGIVPAQDAPSPTGKQDLSLGVYVTKKLPVDQLSPAHVVPPILMLRSRGKDIPVKTRIIEIGAVSLESPDGQIGQG